MNEQSSDQPPVSDTGEPCRAQAARDGAMMLPVGVILRELMAQERDQLFSDAIIARCGAMIGSFARQLLQALAQKTGESDIARFLAAREDSLVQAFMAQGDLLAQCHAGAVESVLADKLHERAGIDPVTAPLLKTLLAAEDSPVAGAAMHVLAAQARFMHSARRMELPLHELAGEHFHRALAIFAEHCYAAGDAPEAVTASLGSQYDEGAARVPQMARLLISISDNHAATMRLDEAGLSIFATALAAQARQGREQVVLAMGQSDPARLVVMMRAANMPHAALTQALITLHPQAELDEALASLQPEVAAQLLADAAARMQA